MVTPDHAHWIKLLRATVGCTESHQAVHAQLGYIHKATVCYLGHTELHQAIQSYSMHQRITPAYTGLQ